MKKLVSILFLFALVFLPKAVLAVGETCPKVGVAATSACCTAPTIIQQVGGCPTGTYWIGDAATGQCKPTITCPGTANSLSCNTGSCYTPPPPPGPGPACPTATARTDSGLPCCTDGQLAVRDSTLATGWRCSDVVPGLWLKNGTSIYYNGGNVGIGTNTPSARLDIENTTGGALSVGESNNTPTGDNSVAIGSFANASGYLAIAMGLRTTASANFSFATGADTIASGFKSTAMGDGSVASGMQSTAMGAGTDAIGGGSTATGYLSQATGNYSTAMGFNTAASGTYAFSIGAGAIASGHSAVSIGRETTASGDYSTAMGAFTTASNTNSTALGYYSSANGMQAFAVGNYATANGQDSTAIGKYATTNSPDAFVVGTYNLSTGSNPLTYSSANPLFVVGNGANASSLSNAVTVLRSGNVGIGTASPTALLDVTGTVRLRSGAAAGSILTSDASGNATWQVPVADTDWVESGGNVYRSSGNVGIGTASPSAKLDVDGTVRLRNGGAAGRVLTSDASGNATWAVPAAGGDTDWVESGGNVYRSAGNVGIGTSTPTSKLSIYKDVPDLAGVATDGIIFGNPAQTTGWAQAGIWAVGASGWNGSLVFGTDGDGVKNTNVTEKMRIDKDGRVGIGTSAPGAKLAVVVSSGGAATIGTNRNEATGTAAIAMGDNNNASGIYSVALGGGDQVNSASGQYAIVIGRNLTASEGDSMAIGNNSIANGRRAMAFGTSAVASGWQSMAFGNVNSEAYNSFVIGRFNVQNAAYTTATWAASDPLFVIGNGSTTSNRANAMTVLKNGQIGLGSVTAPTYRLELPNTASNAGGRGYANSWVAASDSRVKVNQQPLEYGLKEILALQPKSYEHYSSHFENGELVLEEGYSHAIGLVAQEVFEIIPEVTNKPENEESELWGMDYDKLAPVLVKAIQELKAENDALKSVVCEIKPEAELCKK